MSMINGLFVLGVSTTVIPSSDVFLMHSAAHAG
jgi:hypothetical protein